MRKSAALVVGICAFLAMAASSEDRGRAIATELGCLSCHGEQFEGKRVFDQPDMATLWSSNLTRAMPRYTDAQLAKVIGTGERPDGSKLWYMDAAPYAVLTPADMRALIGFLRKAPAVGENHPRIRMGPRFAEAIKAGHARPESDTLARDLANPAADLGARHALGRYLARTRCGVCHSPDLSGAKEPQDGDPPNLTVAASYTREQFRTLVRTGKGIGGRELGEMSTESRKRFAKMDDAAIDAMHRYLVARAERL